MLRMDRTQRALKGLDPAPLKTAGVLERTDLQTMIVNSPDAFWTEIRENLLLIGQGLLPTDVVDDRVLVWCLS